MCFLKCKVIFLSQSMGWSRHWIWISTWVFFLQSLRDHLWVFFWVWSWCSGHLRNERGTVLCPPVSTVKARALPFLFLDCTPVWILLKSDTLTCKKSNTLTFSHCVYMHVHTHDIYVYVYTCSICIYNAHTYACTWILYACPVHLYVNGCYVHI